MVDNTWFNGATLLVDGQTVARCGDLFALKKERHIMTATVNFDGVDMLIEVYIYAIFTVKIKICVDGSPIGGEVFSNAPEADREDQ